MFASLTLIGGFDPRPAEPLAAKLLVVTGDHGPIAETVRSAMNRLPGAQLVALRDYEILGWTDVAAERTQELGAAMLQFLGRMTGPASIALRKGEGEAAGITYRIRGAGPPLVLLPMFLAPSQWEPLVPLLSEQYCTITLGGAVALLESRGRAAGYLQMVRTLLEFDAELAGVARVLELARECGFRDLIEAIEGDIRSQILPGVARMLVISDGEPRREIAERYQRLRALLPTSPYGEAK